MMKHRLRHNLWILTGQFREHLAETYNEPRAKYVFYSRRHFFLFLCLFSLSEETTASSASKVVTAMVPRSSFPHSWLMTGFVTRVTRRVSHVEQERLTLPEQTSSPMVVSVVRGARTLVFCVIICRLLFVLLSFFIWPLYCLSISDLRLLITPLVS